MDEEFGGFAVARWPDLEAVALLATLDRASARDLTADTLRAVRADWPALAAEGAPGRRARAELLARVARLRPDRRPPHPTPEAAADAVPLADDDARAGWQQAGTLEPAVRRALLGALAGAGPLARAAVAARSAWEAGPGEVADLAGVAPDRLASELEPLESALVAAHRAGLAAADRQPADWRLDGDLADLVAELAAGQPAPPDHEALVGARATAVRRRALVAGGLGAAALVGGGAWALARRQQAAPAASRPSASPTPSTAGPDDPAWRSTDRWPVRGRLARDLRVQARLRELAPEARLVFADDVEGLRVAIGVTPTSTDLPSGEIRALAGPAGTPAAGLALVELAYTSLYGVSDAVAAALPRTTGGTRADGGVLVVLTRPERRLTAQLSPTVTPTADGSVVRAWTPVPLREGIGTLVLDPAPGSAARLRVADYDGPMPGPNAWDTRYDAPTLAAYAAETVGGATGLPVGRLRTRVVLDTTLVGGFANPMGAGSRSARTRVEVAHTTTPTGAVVRTARLTTTEGSGDGSSMGSFLLPPALYPADGADEPLFFQLDTAEPDATLFAVAAVGRPTAVSAQVLATTPSAFPASRVTRLTRGAATVLVPNGTLEASYRVVLLDGRGRRLYDDSPSGGRDLDDLSTG